MVDDKVLSHPVAALAEPIFKSTNQRQYILPRRYPRHPHAVHSPCLLRLARERRGQCPERQPTQERSPVHHWITSSARSSSVCGIMRPSALAVLSRVED